MNSDFEIFRVECTCTKQEETGRRLENLENKILLQFKLDYLPWTIKCKSWKETIVSFHFLSTHTWCLFWFF